MCVNVILLLFFILLLLCYFSQNHQTPLHFASRNGCDAVVKLLVKAGANHSAVDRVCKSFIDMYFTLVQVNEF